VAEDVDGACLRVVEGQDRPVGSDLWMLDDVVVVVDGGEPGRFSGEDLGPFGVGPGGDSRGDVLVDLFAVFELDRRTTGRPALGRVCRCWSARW